MNGHEPRFTEFRLTDTEHPFLEINILSVKSKRFANPHPGHGKESE